MNIKMLQILLQRRQLFFIGNGLKLCQTLGLFHLQEFIPVFIKNTPGGFHNILAMIAVFREFTDSSG